jgi:hypothetical protein
VGALRRVTCECGREFTAEGSATTHCTDCREYRENAKAAIATKRSRGRRFDGPGSGFLPPAQWKPQQNDEEGGLA